MNVRDLTKKENVFLLELIPGSKFYPPPHDPGRHLFRESLINRFIGQVKTRQLTLIEAQQGQGKSTVAAQMAARLNPFFVGWYQVGPEDNDPVRFLAAIVACLMNAMPAFSSPLLADMAAKGGINPQEYPACIDMLRRDLARYLTKDCFLVFDDVHFLENSASSQAILSHLIRYAPKRLHFILASRHAVLPGKEHALPQQNVLKLGNRDIQLSEDEVFALCNDVLQMTVSHSEARELWKATEGWVMGLLLVSREKLWDGQAGLAARALDALQKARTGSLADFFREEVFYADDDDSRRILCKLALLSSIPLALAEQLNGDGKVGALLKQLVEKNHFIRSLNDRKTEFAFHHLFQESLCLIAGEELSPAERQQVFRTAGDYYSAQKSPEEALTYYVKARDDAAVDRTLERDGLALCALNRLAFLESILARIPDDAKAGHGWISLLHGMMLMAKDPPQSLIQLQRSLQLFTKRRNDFGRLYALAKLLYFHIYVDRKLNAALPILEDLELLFSYIKSRLGALDVMNIAHILSVALAFIRGDFTSARRYSDLALSCDSDLKTEDMLAKIYLAKAWGSFFDLKQFNESIEACHPLSRSPAVTFLNRMLIRLCAIALLDTEADFENFFHHERQLSAAIENKLIAGTLSGPLIRLLKIDIAVSRGEYDQASNLARQGLDDPQAGIYPHYRSQYYHYQSLLQAIAGDRKGAEEAAQKALALRFEVGGKPFVLIDQMIVGSAYAVLGLKDKAEEVLTKAINNSKEIGEELFRAGAHAAWAYLFLNQGQKEQADRHVRECLRCLKSNGYRHFLGWTPVIMQRVLSHAVAHDIEARYAGSLATGRIGVAFLAGGNAIPLMNIKTLGHFSLSLSGRVVRAEDLTPAMRELLALVVSSPDLKMYQEEILTILWPDIPAAKARSRFDTLLLELRRVLKAALGNNGLLDHYVVMKRGMLCLLNCRVDADQFAALAGRGLAHARNREFWQAGNRFRSASLHWQGTYLAGIRGKDRVNSRGYDLEHLYQEMSVSWGRILLNSGQYLECIDVMDHALRHDRINDALVSLLYQAYLNDHQPIRANELLGQYEEALRAAEYEPEEIAECLRRIWDIPTPGRRP